MGAELNEILNRLKEKGLPLSVLSPPLKEKSLETGTFSLSKNTDAPVPIGVPDIDAHLLDQGLKSGATHEFIPTSFADYPAALGFLLAMAGRTYRQEKRPVIWCASGKGADRPSLPYPYGLLNMGLSADDLLCVQVESERDMLWVLEEALSAPSRPHVIGLYPAAEKMHDFTASRRLSLRCEKNQTRLFLLHHHSMISVGGSTAAATRWTIQTTPSAAVFYSNSKTPSMGPPRWHISLTQCKRGRPGNWKLEWDYETLSFHLVSPLAHRTLATRAEKRRTELAAGARKRLSGRN